MPSFQVMSSSHSRRLLLYLLLYELGRQHELVDTSIKAYTLSLVEVAFVVASGNALAHARVHESVNE
jgi:hypothetical protein